MWRQSLSDDQQALKLLAALHRSLEIQVIGYFYYELFSWNGICRRERWRRPFIRFESRFWGQVPQALLLHSQSWMPLASTSSGLTISQEISFPNHRLCQAEPAFHHALLFYALSKAHNRHLFPGTRRPFLAITVSFPPFGEGRMSSSRSPAVPAPVRPRRGRCPWCWSLSPRPALPGVLDAGTMRPYPLQENHFSRCFLPKSISQEAAWYGFVRAEWEKHFR